METFVAVTRVIDEINRLSLVLGDDIVSLKRQKGTPAEDVAPEGIDAEIEAKAKLANSLANARESLVEQGDRLARYCGAALEIRDVGDIRFASSLGSSLRRLLPEQ